MFNEVLIKDGQVEYRLFIRDIMYITKSDTHQLKIVSYRGTFLTTGTLIEWESKSPSFVFCHRSIVVNLVNILRIDRSVNKIYFFQKEEVSEECNVSRRERRKLLLDWSYYLGTD